MSERNVVPLVRGVKLSVYGTNAEILKQCVNEGLVPADVYRETQKVIERNEYLEREVEVQTAQKEMLEENLRYTRSIVAEGTALYYQQRYERKINRDRTSMLIAAGTMIGIAVGSGMTILAAIHFFG